MGRPAVRTERGWLGRWLGGDRAVSELSSLQTALADAARQVGDRARTLAPSTQRFSEAEQTRAARQLNGSAAVLALSVLADSGLEHYRGSFNNKLMFTPLVTASLTLGASLHGMRDTDPHPTRLRDAIYILAALTGMVGTGMHFYNVGKREGGFSWLNFFYGAPVGAPMAMFLSGALGMAAERVRDRGTGLAPDVFGLPAGPAIAGLTSAGLLGTVGEVGLLHFRGAYHDPAMFLPVTMPPVAAALLANAALGRAGESRPVTRWWLRLTAVMGLVGVGFHIFGVHRNMGGWRNWKQNILNGPPLPAPPSFTGLAIAGLAALGLMKLPES